MKNTTIIAEIGNTHEGSIGLAKCFIKSAAECGVDAVKFQTHIFDAESLPNAPNPPYFADESRKEYFDRTGFSLPNWLKLKQYAEEECGVAFYTSVFSLEAIDLMEKIDLNAYKIPSGEVSNIPLLTKVSRLNKTIFLSSGMSSWQELDDAVATLQECRPQNLILMQCTSEYPCASENAGLNLLKEMKTRYSLPVGFSDHTLGNAISIAAVCLGACVIEKHFTLSKSLYGPDARFSATPDEMKALVDDIRAVEKTLECPVDKDQISKSMSHMKTVFEKSIVAACDMSKGTVIKEEHLAYKKPGDGIPARKFQDILGKKIICNITANTKLDWEMIEDK